MTTFNLRRAQIDGVWGAVPDRHELHRNAGPTFTNTVLPATATTATPYYNQTADIQQIDPQE